MPPKEDQLTSRAKTQLGWGDDNVEDYKKWRRYLKAYAVMNEITGRRGISKAVWEGFKAFALKPKNELPASRHTLLGMQRGDKEGNKAQERFHHLLLDSLKKDRETETRDSLTAASRWRENNRDNLEVAQPRPIMVASATVRVVIVNPNEAADKNPNLDYIWATATKKQLGAVSKPPGDGGKLEDVEFITSDEDLVNFLEVAKGMYKPTMLQVELNPQDGKGYVRARAAARAAGRYNHEHDDEKAAEAVAIAIFGRKLADGIQAQHEQKEGHRPSGAQNLSNPFNYPFTMAHLNQARRVASSPVPPRPKRITRATLSIASSSISMPAEMTIGREISDGIRKRKRKELELYELPGNKNIRNKREDIVSIPSDSECEDVGNGTPDDEASESDEVVVKQLLSNGKKSRSFAAILSELQSLCFIAQAWITDYTFFRLPFLSSLDVINLIHESWETAQDEKKSYLWRTKEYATLLKSIHSRIRSYVVHECRRQIVKLYKLDYQTKKKVEKKVNWLLHGDRFVCREEQRERQKMRGNRDPTFFDKINSVFICLVASALQHCLKEWKTSERTKVLIDYKYETAAEKLILVNIKADLRTRISGFDKKVEVESSEPCAVVENGSYLDELQQKLQMTMEIQQFPVSDVMRCTGVREEISNSQATASTVIMGSAEK
ncbi:hypothetical protein EV426DRAFT_578631 [Tirmania nivea]|nr:hypothetical protein EV426DRAFT_578631 [Tirmania nivea]